MIKLFISQPMRGKSSAEIKAEREEAILKAKDELCTDDIEVIDSYFEYSAPSNTNEALYDLGRSLMLLATADAAFFVRGWDQARGCKIEHTAAIEYGIKAICYDTRM